METTFIYALLEPGTQQIRYVGKSNAPKKRFRAHLTVSVKGNSHLGCWLKGLKALGKEPEIEILDEVPVSQWEFWEREYIRVFRAIGIRLVNVLEGGDGAGGGPLNNRFGKPGHWKGRTGAAHPMFGKPGPMLGKTGAAHPAFGKPGALLGVPWSPERRAKISATKAASRAVREKKKNESPRFI